ncbi:hypothetical protein [Elioraea sp. Yellowstone]|jgi:hypothetical protein|uniref:hypothetical protein n=1 Tax=Elioraea sp. Yellowstone TaxID=2592070 RepID=UPI001F2AEC8D|nr:hypothetical protein [Elioraea sp. Yellowstone]
MVVMAEHDPQAVGRPESLSRDESDALARRRRARNRALFLVLLGLVALFYALTMSRLSEIGDPQQWSRPGAIAPSR